MAAKLGIVGLSRGIALDMQRFNVRSNCIAPFAWTRMIDSIPAETEEEKARVERFREMTPEKIAPLVVYLASDSAEGISGQIFSVRNNEIFCSTRRGRSAPCIAPTAGRRRSSMRSSRALRPLVHAARPLRATCFPGIRCDGHRLRQTDGARNSAGRADLHDEGLHALCARHRARPRSDERGRTAVRLREKSQSAADHGARCSAIPASGRETATPASTG